MTSFTATPGAPQPPRAEPRSVPPPRLYVYFDAIIRHGSIRGAAEALRIASSALNRRVLDLEREVGAVLFDRLPSGVRLTEAGEIFAAHVRRTLNDIRQVDDQLRNIQGLHHAHVSIGSAESAAIEILPRMMIGFRQAYPGARFTLAVGAPGEMLADLLADRVDLILTHEEPSHYDIMVLAAARMPFCALMRHDHPLAARPSLMIGECQDFPIVLAQEQLAARALVEAALRASSLTMQPVLVTNMFEVMKQYVRLTDAISFQFHLASSQDIATHGLVAIPLADAQLAETRLSLAVRRGRALPESALAVCARIKDVLGQAAR